jgi:hypothetical protein
MKCCNEELPIPEGLVNMASFPELPSLQSQSTENRKDVYSLVYWGYGIYAGGAPA